MKLVLLLLACGISASLQQDMFWSFPYSLLDYFTGEPSVHQEPPIPVRRTFYLQSAPDIQKELAPNLVNKV